MKRTLALTLTVLMVLTLIPASLLNVLARGPGVAANVTTNQTIPNADGQFIPETVVVDGVVDDTAWPADDWKAVSSDTGSWNVQYPSDANATYSYRYQIKADYYFLYGVFELPSTPVGLVTIYLNDGSAKGRYTDLFTFDVANNAFNRVAADGTAITDKSPNYYEKSKYEIVVADDGSVTIEFKSLLADFCPNRNPDLTYFVSVECADKQALYHPMIEINEGYDRNACFPSLNASTWNSTYAGKIDVEDIQGYGDYSVAPAIKIDGEFDESYFAQHTDFYSKWYERTNLVSYKDGLKDYSDLDYNKLYYANYIGGEHDLRVMLSTINGAALILDQYAGSSGSYQDTVVYYNMFQKYSDGNYDQIALTLRKDFSDSTYTKAAATYIEVRDGAQTTSTDVSAAVTWGCISTGSPNMYTFEFSMPRTYTGYTNFAPTEYNFVACAYPDSSTDLVEDYCAYGYNYPVTHYRSVEGGEYFNPYTGYTPDGFVGVRAWPGLVSAAGSDFNSNLINVFKEDGTTRISDRIIGMNYLHTLVSDYEFLYGAIDVRKYGVTSTFTEWRHGNATDPGNGDFVSIYLSPDEGTTVYRYDVWTYEDGDGNVSAVIGFRSGSGVYYINQKVKAAYVHRVDDVWAFEYRIPVSSIVPDGLSYTQSVADNSESNISPEILQYYVALNVAAGTEGYEDQHISMLWPRSDNTVLPQDDGFVWNTAYDTDTYDTAEVLKYEDVIRSIEPDGRIVEAQRVNLEPLNYSNAEYRDVSVDGNVLSGHKRLAVGKDYIYLCARFNGDLVANTTRTILWIKNSEGAITKYEWYHNGTSNQMAVDGVDGYVTGSMFGYTSANGATNFEAVLPVDDFSGDNGFEYFIEIQQVVGGEVLNRVSPKIELPEITGYEDYFDLEDDDWTHNAGTVSALIHFDPEKITIDGYLNDNGWDPDEWIYASVDNNASIQETQTPTQLMKSDFYYQLRVDDEYLYVGAVIKYHAAGYYSTWEYDDNGDPLWVEIPATYENICDQDPNFRIWIKSGTNGSTYSDTNTYTTYYDIRLKDDINTTEIEDVITYQNYFNTFPSYANNTRDLFNKNYDYVNPDDNRNGLFEYGEGADWDVVDSSDAFHTYIPKGYGDSVLWGYTKQYIKENEAVIVDENGQTKGEKINPEDYEANGMLDHEEEGVESGVMVSGNGRTMYRDDSQILLGEETMIVEFKVELEEFGGHDQFQYYVQTGTHAPEWGGSRVGIYPAVPSEVDSGSNYFHYYYPYWFWQDGNSITVTESLREDMTLRTYKKPVITLGAKVSDTYKYKNNTVNAIRFGGLWTEEYIRKVNGLSETDGYHNGNYTDYWDVQAMGMVVMPTHLVNENTREDRYNTYSSHAGRYELFQDTTGAAWMDADGIVSWVGGTTSYPDTKVNFADYTNFAFYVTVVNCPTNMNFCFRGFVNYYDDCNNSYSYHDVILERSFNMVVDKATNSSGGAWEENVALKPGQFTDETYKPGTSVDTDDDKVNEGGTTTDPTYDGITPAPDADQKTIAYVPLDNRPVNVDRVQYVAGASGFTLRMPDEADYVTVMDTNVIANDGVGYAHGGNPENILNWLKSQELAGVDYYVISLDQMFSGGLCESRLEGNITELDLEIADYIIKLAKDSNNHVVLGDTLMRLAPETEYKGYTAAEYNLLRAYGMQDRLVLSGSDLTLANVIANYTIGADGNELPTTVTHWSIEGGTGTVDEGDLKTHLDARARKLTLIDYVIRNAGASIDKLFIAVDDSSSSNNIQVNDRNYIAKTAGELGVSYKMFAGADELGMLGVAETASYKYTRNDVPVNVVYFGDGKTITPADAYDYASLETSIDTHLAALGATNTGNRDANTLQILVLTRAQKEEQYVTNPDAPPHEQITATITSEDTETIAANAALLAAQLKANLEAGIPTCIIDGSNAGAGNSRILSEALLNTAWGDEGYNLGEVLSYSCWNTIGNTVGIGLSNAIGRFTYIYNNDPTSASNEAFVKGLTFSLVKDQAYRAHTSGNGGGQEGVYLVGYNNFEFDYDSYDSVNNILAKLNAHNTILGKNGNKAEFGTVSVSGVEWTWDREFECRFDISVESIGGSDEPIDPSDVVISSIEVVSTGTASEGNPLFYATLNKINGKTSLVGVANSGFSMQWYLDDNTPLYPSSSIFAADTAYDLFIKVTCAEGYTFADTVTYTLITADGTYTGVIDTNNSTEDVAAFDFIVTGLDDPNVTTITVDNVNGEYDSSTYVYYYSDTTSLWTASEYTNSSILTWSAKALLEWDDNTNTYKVIATEAAGGTTYTSWDYGIDRIIFSAHNDGNNSADVAAVSSLQIGQRLTMDKTLAEIKALTAGYNTVTVNVLSAVEDTITVPKVESFEIADLVPNSTSQTVAYVPLDNRPVHTDRVKYLATASGITLSMPSAADYATTMGTDGTQSGGNPANILAWLKAQETAGVDYYVIALDQVFSGGLVASREASGVAENGALSAHDLEAIAFLTELAKSNYVVYTDTVIRLAMTTSGYGSYSDTLYNAMRNYGIAAREKLGEDGNRALTLDNVISSYRYNDTGVEAVAYGSLTEDQLDNMLDARERKLRIIDALIKSAGGNIDRLIVGLDDANATNHNLQSNELAYIKQIATTCKANLYTIAGADEMGLMGLAAVANNQFAADPIKVQFVTFGVTDAAADGYDYGTLYDSLQNHLAAIGGVEVTDAAEADIQILVLGRGAEALETASTTAASTYATQLVTKLLENLEADIPTAVIDASNHYGGHANILIGAMIDGGVFTDRTDAAEILGYSQWNTVGNAVGISMSNAMARYAYLTSGAEVSAESNAAFVKAYVFSMVKDNVYRANAVDGWTLGTASALPNGTITAYGMLNYIHNSTNILGKDCESVAYDKVATVWVGETIVQPWGRPFEVSLEIGGVD